MSTNVIVTAALEKKPKSFKDLKKEQLVAAAEYFGTESEGNVESLRADLADGGITWAMYHNVFIDPDNPIAEAVTPDEPAKVDVEDWTDAQEGETVTVTTAPAVPVLTQEKYLIKMVRENPYFEFKKYKFTQEKPYALMDAKDAQEILSTERDFRQAFPDELQEFYS